MTVRFHEFTTWQKSPVHPLVAYQKGQCAGFSLADAQRIVASGAGEIVEGGTAVQRARRALGY